MGGMELRRPLAARDELAAALAREVGADRDLRVVAESGQEHIVEPLDIPGLVHGHARPAQPFRERLGGM
jgi:hypothetical protein